MRITISVLITVTLLFGWLLAGTTGSISGEVKDPQDHPVASASVELRDRVGGKSIKSKTDAQGRYEFSFVEIGKYELRISHPDFVAVTEEVIIKSNEKSTVDISFKVVRGPAESITVDTRDLVADHRSASSRVLLSSVDFEHTAGGSDTIKALVNRTGTAVVSQEHLHMRGAHQVGIEVNGVLLPDLSLFGALTPYINPRDIRYAEVITGGLPAEFGSRTGGIINIISHSGSDPRTKKGRVELSGGNLRRGGTFLSYGDRVGDYLAYYVSLNGLTGKRGINPPPLTENLALPPSRQTIHNRRRTYNNLGGFDFKLSENDMLGLTVGGYRSDFQIPNNLRQEIAGRDYTQLERDHFQNLKWSRTIGTTKLLDVSLYHHFNKVEVGGRRDQPFVAIDNRRVDYYGSRADLSSQLKGHFVKIGGEVYFARLRDDFTILPSISSSALTPFRSRQPILGKQQSLYAHDQINLTDALALNLGLRFDAFQAKRSAIHFSPRIGLAYKIPTTQFVLFGSVARMFLPPPIEFFNLDGRPSALEHDGPDSGPFSDLLFVPARPEIDTQYELGARFPLRAYRIKVTHWYKNQRHFLDHEQLEHPSGDANIFLPTNIQKGRSWGLETYIESPRIKGLSAYVNHAFGYAQAKGNVTGGLIKLNERRANKFFFLDHDQRHTLAIGFNYQLEQYGAWVNGDLSFGSGFPDASNTFLGGRLPNHTTVDLSVGKRLTENWDVRMEVENITNRVYPINLSSEFNGTHYSAPKLFTLRLDYRF